MKHNKKIFLWIAIAAALVLLILSLSMCTGRKPAEPQPEESRMDSLLVEEEETAQTTAPEETTEATEDTEPTEETEPEETESTTPTSGSSNPGGSGGYDPIGDDYDDGTGGETTEVTVPAAGSQGNPYLEMITDYPGSVTTVNLSAGGGVHYLLSGSAGSILTIESPNARVVCGEITSTPDESGVLTLDLSEATEDPVMALTNTGTEAEKFILKYMEALGGRTNPVILEDIGQIDVRLSAEDADGCYYLWNAVTTGRLTLTCETEGLEIIITVGEDSYKLSESTDAAVSCPIVKGEDVLIQVVAVPDEDGKYPEIRATITGLVEADPGTEENPLPQTLTELPGSFTTCEIPAGGQVFYSISGVNGTILTLESADAALLQGETVLLPNEEHMITLALGAEEPILLGVENRGTEAAVFELKFALPLGTQGNPQVLESIDTVAASLAADCRDGYWFRWTAAEDGTVQFAVTESAPEGAPFNVGLRKEGAETEILLSESEDSILRMDVTAGDRILLHFMASPDEEGNYPEVQITLYGTFLGTLGTEENPILISNPTAGYTVTVEAEETVYLSGFFHEMTMTIPDAADASVIFEDVTYAADEGILRVEFPEASGMGKPAAQSFALHSGTAKTYSISFAFPAGHQQNPIALILGSNTAAVKENADGCFFTWTADCDGELTITMPGEGPWQYVLNNLTASQYGDTRTSADSPNSETVTVTAGDQLQLVVNTFDPEDLFSTPAGSVTFTASFLDPLLGTESKPIALAATDSFTVPAGKAVYYTGGAEGMIMELKGNVSSASCGGREQLPLDGVLSLTCVGAKPVILITAAAEEDAVCTVRFTYPVGHTGNPEEMVPGDNEIDLEAGSGGYTFVWIADRAGELRITMDSDTWQYSIRSEAEESGEEWVTSEESEQPHSCTVSVAKGDRILLTVNTFDPKAPGVTPAGKVAFTADFAEPEPEPVALTLEPQESKPEEPAEETPPEETEETPPEEKTEEILPEAT